MGAFFRAIGLKTYIYDRIFTLIYSFFLTQLPVALCGGLKKRDTVITLVTRARARAS